MYSLHRDKLVATEPFQRTIITDNHKSAKFHLPLSTLSHLNNKNDENYGMALPVLCDTSETTYPICFCGSTLLV